MDLNQALDDIKFDVRMVEWNLRQGLITQEDLEKHLKDLRDHAHMATEVTLEDSNSDL